MRPYKVFTFGYSKHHGECWFTRYWHIGMNDTVHDQWWTLTLGMDGVDVE